MSEQIAQTPTLTTVTLTAADRMVDEVASIVGGASDPEVREKAITCLDRAADRLNLNGIYLFRRKESTFSSLTAGQSTLTLPSDWGWPIEFPTLWDSAGKLLGEMQWLPWELFRSVVETTDTTQKRGLPGYATILSEMDGTASIYPYVDTSKLSTIRVPYLARVLRPSEAGDGNLYMTKEVHEVLITGGQAMMVQFRHLRQPQIWIPLMREFEKLTLAAVGSAARQQDAMRIFARPDLGPSYFPAADAGVGIGTPTPGFAKWF